MDGTQEPYYGGTAGKLKGHKFSLYEGGIRSPGMRHWTERISAGQVIQEFRAAMDVFPTLLNAVGGDASKYELDGLDSGSVTKNMLHLGLITYSSQNQKWKK